MPAPQARPSHNSRQPSTELLFKGVLCALIGLGVLVSPHFITSPGMQGIVAQSSLVGWFALVLGIALMVRYALLKNAANAKKRNLK